MSTRVLRWGLLGTARINPAVITPLRASQRNELVAVASRSAERAQAYAREWGIPRTFGSYETMLADPEIDVIYNSLPNSLHAPWTIKAAQAGKHVLCEKPIANSAQDVDAMAAAARDAHVVVAEAFMYRHHPQTLKVKEILDSGAVGRLLLIRGAYTFTLKRPGINVRIDPELGGGSIWDVGCYPISYTRYLVGAEPIEVFGWQTTGPSGADVAFTGQMRFANDVYAQFDSGFLAPPRTHLEIVGTEGTITLPQPFKPGLDDQILLRRGDNVEAITVPGQELYLGEVEDMADAILQGSSPRVQMDWSRGNVATIVALLKSASTGKPVSIER